MKEKLSIRDITPLAVRMPAAIGERVRSSALENRRSINSEIVFALERFYSTEHQTEKASARS